jgi:hypothetical protein
MAYAVAQDVQDRYEQDLDERLTALVTTRLGDAEHILKLKIPDLDDQILEGVIDVKTVILVESEMILRLIRNPEGFSQESDGNYSYAIYQQVASGKLEVTAEEWGWLGTTDGGMFTISATLPTPTPYPVVDPASQWQINSWGQHFLTRGYP